MGKTAQDAGPTTDSGGTPTGIPTTLGVHGGRPTVTGSKGGNAALASLMSALSQLGLVTDKTT